MSHSHTVESSPSHGSAGRPIRSLVFTTNFRNADNWLDLFRQIKATGGDCRLVSVAWTGDPSHIRMASLGLPTFLSLSITRLNPEGITIDALDAVVRQMAAWEPDVVFVADVQSYPSKAVHGLMKQYRPEASIVGLQHGFFQSWHTYNANFCCDFLFVFGDRHRRALAPQYRERCFVVGLPKLDRLQGLNAESRGYILFLPQRSPGHGATRALLDDLQKKSGTRYITNSHPQFGGLKGIQPVDEPFIDLLSGADWVITSYSTGGIEGLYLGKDVVLLPSHGTVAWHGYPAIARDLTAVGVLRARSLIQKHPTDVGLFLDDAIGGIRFDHTHRAWQALRKIV